MRKFNLTQWEKVHEKFNERFVENVPKCGV